MISKELLVWKGPANQELFKLTLRKFRLKSVDYSNLSMIRISRWIKIWTSKVDDDEINEFLAALSMETGGEISHDDLIGSDSLLITDERTCPETGRGISGLDQLESN